MGAAVPAAQAQAPPSDLSPEELAHQRMLVSTLFSPCDSHGRSLGLALAAALANYGVACRQIADLFLQVEGREQDFGPLPPNYDQATQPFSR